MEERGGEQKGRGFFPALTRHQTPDSEDMSISVLRLQLEMKQDQTSNRYDSIILWLQMENGLMILSHSHILNLEMLLHLKTI